MMKNNMEIIDAAIVSAKCRIYNEQDASRGKSMKAQVRSCRHQQLMIATIHALENKKYREPNRDSQGRALCPVCGRYLKKGYGCANNGCGQAIKWGDDVV